MSLKHTIRIKDFKISRIAAAMRHLLTSHGPKKRQAPSKWVILYDRFYDWPDIICPKSRENKYSLYSNSFFKCISTKTQTFVGNHSHCRWNISIFNRNYIFNPGLFSIPMLPEGTSLAHATFSDSGPQFPPDTLQHMTDGCGTTLGTFFGLCEGRPLSQPMGPPKKGTPWENKVCKMFFGNCGSNIGVLWWWKWTALRLFFRTKQSREVVFWKTNGVSG